MALARSRQAARRVKDRWKAKNWYRVTAPVAFNTAALGETLADEPEKLMGRTLEATMQELTGDFKQMHIKLHFRINQVDGLQAKTAFIGHTMTTDYVRRLTRRGHSKISAVYDLKTNDGSRLRVKPFAITDRRAQTTQIQAIRAMMKSILEEAASKNSLNGLLAEILNGDLTGKIYKEARKVHPIRRVEIAKSELLTAPSIEVDETPVIRLPEPEAEETEGEESEETEATEDEESEGEAEVSEESEGDVDVVATAAVAVAAGGDEEE